MANNVKSNVQLVFSALCYSLRRIAAVVSLKAYRGLKPTYHKFLGGMFAESAIENIYAGYWQY